MKEMVKDVLRGQNWLIYTYGVTNSGKTYTIQGKEKLQWGASGTLRSSFLLISGVKDLITNIIPGTSKDAGILPQSLALIFNSLQGQLHPTPDLKPLLSNEVIWLDSKQIRQEEIKKLSLLIGGLQEVKCS